MLGSRDSKNSCGQPCQKGQYFVTVESLIKTASRKFNVPPRSIHVPGGKRCIDVGKCIGSCHSNQGHSKACFAKERSALLVYINHKVELKKQAKFIAVLKLVKVNVALVFFYSIVKCMNKIF